MKKLAVTTTLLICSLSRLLGATVPGWTQLLITAKQRETLSRPSYPFQLDVDFVLQIRVPTQGHLTLKWEASDRWW